MADSKRLTPALLVLTLICAFSFGAIVHWAFADDYHVTCVGHGFLNNGSTSDGDFYALVQAGCGGGSRSCDLYVSGIYIGGLTTGGSVCDAHSTVYGSFTECHATAHLAFPGVFNEHVHKSSNYCG